MSAGVRMKLPKYRRHSTRDKGFVEHAGKRIYFPGRYNSPESKAGYAECIAKHCGAAVPQFVPQTTGLSIMGLATAFLSQLYESENGNRRGVWNNCKFALKPFVERHGHELAAEFGPLALKRWQDHLASLGKARSYVTNCISAIRETFRWGVSEELLPPSLYHALQSVRGLKPGKTNAREKRKKLPVPWSYLELVLPEVSPTIRAMLLLQWFTGVRSQSICEARPSQFVREGEFLIWSPRHKTESRGVVLRLPLGPRAQAILTTFLADQTDRRIFSPRASNRNRRYKDYYLPVNYNACLRGGIQKLNRKLAKTQTPPLPLWSPHQLRHAKGTMVRAIYGLEATAAVLGHEELSTSEIYSQKRMDLAQQVARETG